MSDEKEVQTIADTRSRLGTKTQSASSYRETLCRSATGKPPAISQEEKGIFSFIGDIRWRNRIRSQR
jgi:hypothetical protein